MKKSRIMLSMAKDQFKSKSSKMENSTEKEKDNHPDLDEQHLDRLLATLDQYLAETKKKKQ